MNGLRTVLKCHQMKTKHDLPPLTVQEVRRCLLLMAQYYKINPGYLIIWLI